MQKNNRDSVYKKFSLKDILVVISALIAVLSLVFFLVYVQKKQQESEYEKIKESTEQLQENTAEQEKQEARSSIRINEISGEGWIELHNTTNVDVEISGSFIEINGERVFEFGQEDLIEGDGYFIVELDSTNEKITGHSLISLVSAENIIISQVLLPELSDGDTYGRTSEQSNSMGYITATKSESNDGASLVSKEYPVFSYPSGFYDEEFKLEIFVKEGYDIYYTLDGSVPTLNSQQYVEPISIYNPTQEENVFASISGTSNRTSFVPVDKIDKCRVVRAIAVDENGIISEVKNGTYFIGIQSNSLYNELPIISIITDPSNLFDYTDGIYVLGENYENALAMGLSTEEAGNFYSGNLKDAYLQYFEATKTLTFSSDTKISIDIDFGTNLPQKTFVIENADNQISKGSEISSLFSNYEESKLILSNGRLDANVKLRNYLISNLLGELSIAKRTIQPCIVFVDGEFWGLYSGFSDYDTNYIGTIHNIEPDNIVLVKQGVTTEPEYQSSYDDVISFIQNNDMQIQSNYENVKNLMDIESYLQIYCANLYLANSDFSGNEMVVWKTKTSGLNATEDTQNEYADGKWRFMLDNVDTTAALSELNSYSINTFLRPQIQEDTILSSLLRNEEFKLQFMETMEQMKDIYFEKEMVLSYLEEQKGIYLKALLATHARFYGIVSEETYNGFLGSIGLFFQQRGNYIIRYTEEFLGQERAFVVEEVQVENEELNSENIEMVP